MSVVSVKIPGPYGSRSKMQKKGWKCWAKKISNVKSPANSGFDWEGEFVNVGQVAEMETGDILLHVDDSSSAGVAVVEQDGSLTWHDSTSDKWAAQLAPCARRLLALEPAARLRDPEVDRVKEILADDSAVVSPFDAAAIAEKIHALFVGLTDEQVAEVYRLLPGVEHKS